DSRVKEVYGLIGEEGYASIALLPIREAGETMGLLSFYYDTKQNFDIDDQALARTFSEYAGTALRNALSLHRAQRETQRLQVLEALNRQITQSLDMDKVLDNIARSAAELLDASYSRIHLLSEDEALLNIRAGFGDFDTSPLNESKPTDWGLRGVAFQTGEPLFIPDVKKDDRWMEKRWAQEQEIFGFIAVPIFIENKVIGTITLMGKENAHITKKDIPLIESLANLGGIAIQNARLFEDLTSHTEKLALSEARFRSIIDSAQDAIIAIDEEGFITLFNAGAEKMFNYSQEDISGKKVNMLMPPPYDIEHDTHIRTYLDTGFKKALGTNRTLDARRKSGEIFPIKISIGEVSVGDRKLFTGVIRDITERHEIDRMKNEFISVVSHEIRTPLTSLRGSLGLLSGGVAGDLNEQGKSLMDIAVNNSDRLIRLINDILDLEKIESGNMELQFSSQKLESLITCSIEEMDGLVSSSGITIETDIEPCQVDADSDSIIQVLTNLISNAVKFSESGSRVLISSNCLMGEAEIRVVDQGRGIPPEALDSIFDRFRQVDSSDIREKGGTGLGLAICNAIVRQHGGHIWVESELGSGSTFSFSLPQTKREPAPAPEPIPQQKPTKATVLLCEDDRDFVRLIELLVESEGYDFIPTFSAEEALAYLQDHKVDAMLLDINLPGMSGIDLLNEVKNFPDDIRPPVIVISLDDPLDIADLPAPFLMDWITKPLDEGRLLARLKAALKVGKVANVLVVDDDPDLRAIVTQLLEEKNIRVETAESGIEAVKQFHNFLPELIILDIMMPSGDGFYVMDSLRGELERRKTPIIVYSSKEPTPAEKKRLSTETTVFLTKSKTSQDLFTGCVVDLLNGLL
ncbi:MAG: response regulator, partial [Nitrospinaceae bacterium]|nr:response regulator [Nitrospinaceae bacterium]